MKENRYPVTMIGMEKLLDTLIGDWEAALKQAETRVQLYPQARVGEVECTMHEVVHPQPREELKFHRTRVYFDKKTNLPIRVERHGFPKTGEEPPLVEEYMYADVKIDVAPSESDFDIKNAAYGFK